MLALDPDNSQATAGFSLIAERYLELATTAFEKGQEKKAQQYVTLGLRIKNDHPELLAFHHRLASQERHSGGRDEPRATGKSNTRNDPPLSENIGASVASFSATSSVCSQMGPCRLLATLPTASSDAAMATDYGRWRAA